MYRRFPELALLPKVDAGIVAIAGRHFPLGGPLAVRCGKPHRGRHAAGWGMRMILKCGRPSIAEIRARCKGARKNSLPGVSLWTDHDAGPR
jgi:hypothetical protein